MTRGPHRASPPLAAGGGTGRRRVAWTRLVALALAAALVVQAALHAAAATVLGLSVGAMQAAGALFLLQKRTRSIGVLVGVAAVALAIGVDLLDGSIGAAGAPTLVAFGLLILAGLIDREHRSGIAHAPSRNCR